MLMKEEQKYSKKKFNILFISHERKLGGASRSLVALAKELQLRGHNIYVVVLLKRCPLAIELEKNGIVTIPIFFGWWMCPVYWNRTLQTAFKFLYYIEYIACKYLTHIVKKYDIDIIHSNSSTIDIGAKVARTTNRKHVWHFREFGMEDFELKYMNGREKSIQYIQNNSDGIIFISRKLRQAYHDIKDEKKIRVIYNGISKEYLQTKIFSLREQTIFVVSGTIIKNKNQILVVQAAKRLLEEGYSNFEVWIAGASTSLQASKDYEKYIKNYIKENCMEEHVKMLGYVKNMKEVRAKGDVEIVASKSEAFGRVTVEAMMSSMPVIAANAGANSELIIEEETGYLFGNDSVEELMCAMKRILEHHSEIERMGRRAYQIAVDNFTAERNAEEVEKYYNYIMNKS